MKIFFEFAVIFGIGLGEGLILCDWWHCRNQVKAKRTK